MVSGSAKPALATLSSVLVALLLLPACTAEERIACFLIGSVQNSICPLPGFFAEDPLFTYESDPHQAGLSLEERTKLDRLYFPRTRQRLLEKYDMVFFADPYIEHFTPRQFSDLHYAFTRDGMPSYWSFGPAYGRVIQGSVLNDVLPISEYEGYYHRPWRPVFRPGRDPVFLPFVSLGMENIPGEAYAAMKPRQGTEIWADMRPLDLPWIVSWQAGGKEGGLAWVYADEFNVYWWGLTSSTRGQNPYALDMMTNMILYSLDQPLLTDIQARREARYRLSTYRTEKALVLSMLDWADMFGANIFALSQELTDLDARAAEALDQYLRREYQGCISNTEEISAGLTRISSDASRLKDQALFWVYLSEWLAVSSVSMITGVLLWTLMVRRRMYRTVKATRISRAR